MTTKSKINQEKKAAGNYLEILQLSTSIWNFFMIYFNAIKTE